MNLFNPRESDAVEDKWGLTPLFDMAESVCNRCLASCRTFRLHPSELLYQCLYIIDTLRGTPRQRSRRWTAEQYSQLTPYMKHHNLTGVSDADLNTNVALILHTTACWLLDASGWTWAARLLEEQIAEHSDGSTAALIQGFEEYLEVPSVERQQFIGEYMNGNAVISQEIDDLLDSLAIQHSPQQTLTQNFYNIQRDFVQQKLVENEVNGVQNGGIGIKTANAD